MDIVVATVGRIGAGPERDLFVRYTLRLHWRVAVVEVVEKRPLPRLERMARETALLLAALPRRATVVALDERGTVFPSAVLAARLQAWQEKGTGCCAFVIGGADGLTEAVRERAELVLSLGLMTWPHRLVRVLLAEQLYRAQSLLDGHPYHRG
ncbi:MAG: 23S rRNA (pseudouridine1915-N3)-methyltransferase [Rhodospirillaceae bacterium]|nr:MAG: 23S rRNA (pseudouridine1915-N3)-methyltransferase [Rhodospirillaceae bacterium]